MTFTTAQIEDLHRQLREHLGPVVCAALEDESVTDIKCSDGVVWLAKHQINEVPTQEFLSEAQRRAALNLMATLLGKEINERAASLSGELPLTGDRIQGFVLPIAPPSFFIRRHAPEVFTWDDYVRKEIMGPWQVEVLRGHIARKSNIVISGATGSGKTTLLNTCVGELVTSNEHVLIIEDTAEIKCTAPNQMRMLSSREYPLRGLVIDAMRVAPKRLIIGETRDAAGVELLNAWITGHGGGLTTIHAKGARAVFQRFAQFCQQAGQPPQWLLMQDAIDLIVHMEMTRDGRRVTEIMEVSHEDVSKEIPITLKKLEPPKAME